LKPGVAGPRRQCSLLLAAAALCGWAAGAHAQDAEPLATAGAGPEVGGLHDAVAAAFAGTGGGTVAPPTTTPAWLVTPAITVQQEWTDNALQTAGVTTSASKQASFITVVMPSLAITGETSRLTANLTYAPSASYYTSVQGQNSVVQNLSGSALATLVPDQLFLSLQGFATEQALNGATAPNGTVALSRQNAVQTYDFSASPYLDHRFGGWGTAEIGASATETLQGALSGTLPGGTPNQNTTTTEEFASFTSGENFGRLLSTVTLSATQNSGAGVLQGAYRDIANYQAGYAISHTVAALASIGWEDILYTGIGGTHFDDLTWSVGAKLTPNPDSSITVQYGHQDGATAASLDASYAPTARTRLYARYADGVSTDTEELQNALANAQFDPLGQAIDRQTGAPLLLANNFYGVTTAVYRQKSASVSAAWLFERETVQVSFSYQSQTPIGTDIAGTVANTGTYGSVSWEHALSDALTSDLYFQYGRLNQTGGGISPLTTTLVVASAALSYRFSETLSGSLQYSYTSDAYTTTQQPGTAANLAVLSLRKTF
jgi:uncharacterized protein (PEP-CTERM system associated)